MAVSAFAYLGESDSLEKAICIYVYLVLFSFGLIRQITSFTLFIRTAYAKVFRFMPINTEM
jgi:hypothetical protein